MLGRTLDAPEYLERVHQAIRQLDMAEIRNVADVLERAWIDGRMVFIIGNGGSGANASHLCEDLAKCTLCDFEGQRRLRILSLTDNTPWLTAIANDISYECVFVEQLKTLATPGDLVMAISGSGNSPNVVTAVEWANAHGLSTLGITGYDGGKLRRIAHHGFHVAIDDMGIVESVHMVAFHWIIDELYRRFAEAHASVPVAS